MDGYITTKELSEKLRVTETTIYRWRKKGMPFEKFEGSFRFKETEVMKWLTRNKEK